MPKDIYAKFDSELLFIIILSTLFTMLFMQIRNSNRNRDIIIRKINQLSLYRTDNRIN